MNSQYTSLAAYYDSMSGRSEDEWCDYIASLLEENGIKKGELVLDCACGTGSITSGLAKHGYDMTGFDSSPDMLSKAYENTAGLGVLLLCQSLTDFELYGTVRAAVCCTDSLNYLKNIGEVEKFFKLCRNYIEKNGVLIFDVNTPYKFENIYSDKDYIIENSEGSMLCWSCDYNRENRSCRFLLTVFSPCEDGKWQREDEEQQEYAYEINELKELLENNGFAVKNIYGELSHSAPAADEHRVHFVCTRT